MPADSNVSLMLQQAVVVIPAVDHQVVADRQVEVLLAVVRAEAVDQAVVARASRRRIIQMAAVADQAAQPHKAEFSAPRPAVVALDVISSRATSRSA